MPIKVKDHGKCKEWERRRRDRLNDAFKNLAQLLPHYDPAKIPAKIDILEKSTEFVKELRLSNSRLLSNQAENDEKCKLIKELQDEVNKLIMRVKQLTLLLKKAHITIPTGPSIKSLGIRRFKWSGKVKAEDVENSASVVLKGTLSTTRPKVAVFSSEKDTTTKTSVVSDDSKSLSLGEKLSTPELEKPDEVPKNTPSITIPLRETNCSKVPVEPCSSSPTIGRTSLQLTPIKSNAPTTVIAVTSSLSSLIPEPLFTTTTTPIQLPLQTFILAPCPITSALSAQPSQLLTRFTLPTPILPKSLEGISFQKIAIKPVLKPIPKVIKRRRKRGKKICLVNESLSKIKASEEVHKSLIKVTTEKEIDKQTSPLESETVISEKPSINPNDTVSNNEMLKKKPLEINEHIHEIGAVTDSTTVEDQQRATESSNKDVTISSPGCNTSEASVQLPTDAVTEILTDSIPVLRIIETSESSRMSTSNNGESDDIFSNVVVGQVKEKFNEETPSESEPPLSETNLQESSNGEKHLEKVEEEVQKENPKVDESAVTKENSDTIRKSGIETESKCQDSETAVFKKELDHAQMTNHDDKLAPHPKVDNNIEHGKNSSEISISPNNRDITVAGNTLEKIPVTEMLVEEPETICNTSEPVRATITSSSMTNDSTSNETQTFALTPSLIQSVATLPVQNEVQQFTQLPLNEPSTSATVMEKSIPADSSSSDKPLSLQHREFAEPPASSVTPNDKISECIARSIDLIDANDSELMELGEHWEVTGGSPKSPISPTQMFLNIFPLLPRENSISEPQSQPVQHQQPIHQNTPQKTSLSFPSTSSRSSFFIDAMLPDDHSGNNNSSNINDGMDIMSTSTSLTQCLALTPPLLSSSSISGNHHVASSFANYYWTAGSSCNLDNPGDYRAAHGSQRGSSNTSSMPIATTTPSDNTTTITSATSTANSGKTNVPENQRSKPLKPTTAIISTSTNISKVTNFNYDSFSTFTKPKTAGTSTAITSTASVTWSSTAPTQVPAHSQQSTLNTVQQVTPSQMAHSQSSTTSLPTNGANQAHAPHSCSLLDSLNSMDATFFRPLINALDDFRSLEFPSNTQIPPPPPPLPSLIPPPTKPIHYSQQFNPSTQAIQTPMSVNYHPSGMMTHEPQHPTAIQMQSSIVHHHHVPPPAAVCSGVRSNTSQQPSSEIASAITHANIKSQQSGNIITQSNSAITQHEAPHMHNMLSRNIPESSHQPARSHTTTSSEKISRTSGKQNKLDSTSRQSRSGKSSRTQPYIVPTSHSSQTSNNPKQLQPTPSFQFSSHVNPAVMQPDQSSKHQMSKPSTSIATTSRSYSFQVANINSSSSESIHQNVQQPMYPPSSLHSQQVGSQTNKLSSSEEKVQKNKESRSQSGPSKSRSYQSQPATKSQTVLPTNQPSSNAGNSVVSSTPLQRSPSKLQQNANATSTNVPQSFQFHHPMSTAPTTASTHDSFQLFPDWSGSRQFTNQSHHHVVDSSANQSSHQQSQGFASHFQRPQRAHPYYLPDISPTFDNISMPNIHPPRPQMANSSTSRLSMNNSCNQQTSKFMYSSNSQQPQLPQPSTHAGTLNNARQTQQSNAQTPQQPQRQQPHIHTELSSIHPYPHQQPQSNISQASSNTQPLSVHQAQQRQQINLGDSCHQIQQQQRVPQSQGLVPSSTSTPSSSKSKQMPQIPSFQTSQSLPTHTLNQHHPPSASQQQHSRQPSTSRTVNWMTDTGYRTSSSSSSNVNSSSNAKQRQQQSGPSSNPFSVSKLVGNTAPAKNQSNIEANSREQTHSANQSASNVNIRNKTAVTNPATSGNTNSNNPSNYCAEALIRKNSSEWNDFNLAGSNSNFPSYSHQTSTHNSDHFTNYSNLSGQYHYSGSGQHPPSHTPHFGHFDSHPQHFHGSHQYHQPQPGNYHSTSQHHVHSHPHQSNHYPHHAHHQGHGSSTSSVSNFNLSSIFPEINDKRNSNNNVVAQTGATAGNGGNSSSATGVSTSVNMNPCNYHHPGFTNPSGNSGNLH